jgi:hypothetical protein
MVWKQYQVEVSNRFTSLENCDGGGNDDNHDSDVVDISRA